MKNYSRIFLAAITILTALVSIKAIAPGNDNFADAQNLGNAVSGNVSGNNTDATQETDEPNHYVANPNKQSVWYKWTASSTRSMAFEIMEENFASSIAIYTSNSPNPTFAQLTKIQSTADIIGYQYKGCRINFPAQSGKTYYIAIDYANAGGPGNPTGAFELKFKPNALIYSSRFESRDQRASVGVYRPSNSIWYYLFSFNIPPGSGNQNFYGKVGDQPLPADYTGDGRTDFALVRGENGYKFWYASFLPTVMWGLATDQTVIGDFDDDGRADPTAIRSNGQNLTWYARRSSDNKMAAFTWGLPTDKPVVGDFDGDRITDITVTRSTPSGLIWYILKSSGGAFDQYAGLQFGLDSDQIAVEDYDGDGKTDIAVFRPSTGVWYILRSSTNDVQIMQFGQSGDKPQPADYDGDGKADIGIFRPSTGNWQILMSGSGTQKSIYWGTAGDVPLSSINSILQQ
jgi:hypothetical protein